MRKKCVALFIAAVLGITSINMTAMASEPQEVFIEAEQTGSDVDQEGNSLITEVPDQTSDLQGQPEQEKENTTENPDDFSDTDNQTPAVTGITVDSENAQKSFVVYLEDVSVENTVLNVQYDNGDTGSVTFDSGYQAKDTYGNQFGYYFEKDGQQQDSECILETGRYKVLFTCNGEKLPEELSYEIEVGMAKDLPVLKLGQNTVTSPKYKTKWYFFTAPETKKYTIGPVFDNFVYQASANGDNYKNIQATKVEVIRDSSKVYTYSLEKDVTYCVGFVGPQGASSNEFDITIEESAIQVEEPTVTPTATPTPTPVLPKVTGMRFLADRKMLNMDLDLNEKNCSKYFPGKLEISYDNGKKRQIPIAPETAYDGYGHKIKTQVIDQETKKKMRWYYISDFLSGTYKIKITCDEEQETSFIMKVRWGSVDNLLVLKTGSQKVRAGSYFYNWYFLKPERNGWYYTDWNMDESLEVSRLYEIDKDGRATGSEARINDYSSSQMAEYYLKKGKTYIIGFRSKNNDYGTKRQIKIRNFTKATALRLENVVPNSMILREEADIFLLRSFTAYVTYGKETIKRELKDLQWGHMETKTYKRKANGSYQKVENYGLPSGTYKIKISCDGAYAKDIPVKIIPAEVWYQIPSNTRVPLKQNYAVKINIKALSMNDKLVSWTSSRPKVASVFRNGKVVGKTPGKSVITFRFQSGFTFQFAVVVQKDYVKTSAIHLLQKNSWRKYPEEITLRPGRKSTFTTIRLPVSGRQKIVYSSSDKNIATVDNTGTITARKKGTAVIKVRSGSKEARVTVTVK